MKKFSTAIKSLEIFQDGGAVLICNPTEGNSKGNYRLNPGQVQRLATRCGAFDAHSLKLLIGFGGASYNGESIQRKAGDVWKNEKTGATGTVSKDHFATQNDSIELSMVAKLKLADIVIGRAADRASMYSSYVAPVSQPAKVEEPATPEVE